MSDEVIQDLPAAESHKYCKLIIEYLKLDENAICYEENLSLLALLLRFLLRYANFNKELIHNNSEIFTSCLIDKTNILNPIEASFEWTSEVIMTSLDLLADLDFSDQILEQLFVSTNKLIASNFSTAITSKALSFHETCSQIEKYQYLFRNRQYLADNLEFLRLMHLDVQLKIKIIKILTNVISDKPEMWCMFAYDLDGIKIIGNLLRFAMNNEDKSSEKSVSISPEKMKPEFSRERTNLTVISNISQKSSRKLPLPEDQRSENNPSQNSFLHENNQLNILFIFQSNLISFLWQSLPKDLAPEYAKIEKDLGIQTIISLLTGKLCPIDPNNHFSNGVIFATRLLDQVFKVSSLKVQKIHAIIPRIFSLLRSLHKAILSVEEVQSNQQIYKIDESIKELLFNRHTILRQKHLTVIHQTTLFLLKILNSVLIENNGHINRPAMIEILKNLKGLNYAKLFMDLQHYQSFQPEIVLQAILLHLRLLHAQTNLIAKKTIKKILEFYAFQMKNDEDYQASFSYYEIVVLLHKYGYVDLLKIPVNLVEDLGFYHNCLLTENYKVPSHKQLLKNAYIAYYNLFPTNQNPSAGLDLSQTYAQSIQKICDIANSLNKELSTDQSASIFPPSLIVRLLEIFLRFSSHQDGITEALIANNFCQIISKIFINVSQKKLIISTNYIKSLIFNIICILAKIEAGESILIKICRNEIDLAGKKKKEKKEKQKEKNTNLNLNSTNDENVYYFAHYCLEENGMRIKKDSRYHFTNSFMRRLNEYFTLFPIF